MENLRVETGNLMENEFYILASYYPEITRIDLEELKTFEANYFLTKKLYSKFDNEEYLSGFAIFFLGYNGLGSNDVSIEKLFVNGNNQDTFEYFVSEFMKQDGFPFPVENIYCNEERLNDMMRLVLANHGVKFSRTR